MTEHKKWEYKTQFLMRTMNPSDYYGEVERQLNKWGEEGWEFVAIHEYGEIYKGHNSLKFATFKRERLW